MKIVQLATSMIGGAGIAAMRLNQALNDIGVDSTLISNEMNNGVKYANFLGVNRSKSESFKSKALTLSQQRIIQSGNDLLTPFSTSTLDLQVVFDLAPDVIHIHSFYNLLKTKDIEKLINSGIPMIFTLHDERILTGGCHCTNGCNQFESKCESCPQSRMGFRHFVSKERLYWRQILKDENRITLICPSKWMVEQVKKAGLIPITHPEIIRNPISTNYLESGICERAEELDAKYTITFVSQNIRNSYKGLDNILECIEIYANDFVRRNIQFRFVGHGAELDIRDISYTQYPNLSEESLIEIYRSTDLLLVPSKTDNSPNVVFEAALCGASFLGSNRAGLPELSEMFGNRTFEYGNPHSLFEAILEVKNSAPDRAIVRKIALENVEPKKIAKSVKDLYHKKIAEALLSRSSNEF